MGAPWEVGTPSPDGAQVDERLAPDHGPEVLAGTEQLDRRPDGRRTRSARSGNAPGIAIPYLSLETLDINSDAIADAVLNDAMNTQPINGVPGKGNFKSQPNADAPLAAG
jgi:hypothetical protein